MFMIGVLEWYYVFIGVFFFRKMDWVNLGDEYVKIFWVYVCVYGYIFIFI